MKKLMFITIIIISHFEEIKSQTIGLEGPTIITNPINSNGYGDISTNQVNGFLLNNSLTISGNNFSTTNSSLNLRLGTTSHISFTPNTTTFHQMYNSVQGNLYLNSVNPANWRGYLNFVSTNSNGTGLQLHHYNNSHGFIKFYENLYITPNGTNSSNASRGVVFLPDNRVIINGP